MFFRLLAVTVCIVSFGLTTFAQDQTPAKPEGNGAAAAPAAAIAITPETTPLDLARAAFAAQGGEKFRSLQNITLRGSVQLYAPNSVQSLPGAFSIVTAGPKVRMDVDARPILVFKQIYDGQQSYSSVPTLEMPPLTKFGEHALAKFDQPGYQISAIPDKKKQRGFRLVDPDGYTTDYYLDSKTGKVTSFFIYYGGVTLGTENSKFKDVEGIPVPFSFSKRFETPMGAYFAEFSVKEVKINQQLADDVFVIPR